MAVTFVGMGAQVTGAGPLTPTYPGGYTAVANDWAEIFVVGKGSANTAPATPSGFTSLGGGRDATTTCLIYVFAKLLSTSEAMPSIALPTNWTVFAVQVAIRRGTAAPTDLDTALTSQAAASATTWAPTALTTAQHGSVVVSTAATDFDNAVGTFLNGDGFNERAGGAAFDVVGQFSFAMGDRVVRSAGSQIVMPTWEQTVNVSNPWFGIKYAIKDASPPATSPPYLFAAGALFAVASGTSITPVIPASDAANDILLMKAWANAATTFTTPSGWTVIGTNENSANMSSAWFWKRATGSDGDPTSTTGTTLSATIGGYGRIYVIRGCVTTGDPFEDATFTALDLGTSPDTTVIDTTDIDRLAVAYLIVDDDNVFTAGYPPAGWVSHGSRLVSTVGGDAMTCAIEIDAPTAATVAAVVIGTMANDYNKVLTLAWLPVPSGGTTGTVAVTLGAFAAAGSGTYTPPPVTGTVAVTLAPFTSSAAGTYTPAPVTGTVAVTLAAFTSSASGTVTGPGAITGTVAVTLAPFAASASGTSTPPSFTGTVAVTLAPFVSAAAGTHTPPAVTGTVAVTLAPFVSSASGTATGPGAITGTVAVTLAPFVGAASGTRTIPSFTGTVAVTLASFTSVASGTSIAAVTGTTAVTLAPFTSSATGTANLPAITGTVAVTLGPFVSVASQAPTGGHGAGVIIWRDNGDGTTSTVGAGTGVLASAGTGTGSPSAAGAGTGTSVSQGTGTGEGTQP